jgi:hypothetical protein
MPSIAHLIHVYGLLVVAGLIGLECVGLPSPGETVLIVAYQPIQSLTQDDFLVAISTVVAHCEKRDVS